MTFIRNEIFGIAGVSGNGQRELVEAITGLRTAKRGRILINGIDITNQSAQKNSITKVSLTYRRSVSDLALHPTCFYTKMRFLKSIIRKNFPSILFSLMEK